MAKIRDRGHYFSLRETDEKALLEGHFDDGDIMFEHKRTSKGDALESVAKYCSKCHLWIFLFLQKKKYPLVLNDYELSPCCNREWPDNQSLARLLSSDVLTLSMRKVEGVK